MAETTVQNPLTGGLAKTLIPQPCSLVIFGGGGDLTRRKLLPAVYNLALDGVLPATFAVTGFSRLDLDDLGFRNLAREGVQKFSRQPLDPGRWPDFERTLFYLTGSFDDPQTYAQLKERLEKIEAELAIPGNRVFYLAIPPSFIETCVQQLKAAGMVMPADGPGPFSRIIVEKPVGRDLDSARQVNATLAAVFDERQIFRIDHYLGKETVQNLLVLRFANSIFEPLWNQKYVDHVQITVAEQEGVGIRASYYEEAGALRDMVQNHILQLVCLTAMEPPWALDADVVRDAKLEILRALRPIAGQDVDRYVVRAQYGTGYIHGQDVPGYRREEGVRPDSTSETYVALKLFIDNWRWAGVPFYIRTGKRMPKRATEIAIQFKDVPQILFNADPSNPLDPNVLAIRIQPEEGMSLRISSKLPGPKARVYPVKMDFRYGSTFGEASPEAYERLLLDVMAGDATLFMRRDAVEASWAWVTNILDFWQSSGARWLPEYPAGTWGPLESDRLVQGDNRWWRTL
ncbi:MAG: glucose-6-phosphate dehydrogenase [Candidatus Rokubacteria bacterium]|nr:glucose-6-phosphate dehydrogenase [Candidatus Rokubacteria bacterium]